MKPNDPPNYIDLRVPPVTQGSYVSYPPLEWAKKHCPSYITNDVVQKDGVYYYRFFFGTGKDLTAFALKWL